MINTSKFKCTNEKFKEYVNENILEIMKTNKTYLKDTIYLSAPMTGVDNYSERFNQMKEWIEYIYRDSDICIINPTDYIDNIPKEFNATYMDIMYYCFELIRLCNILIVDDSNDRWIESRGVLTELLYAKDHFLDYIYGYDYVRAGVLFRKYLDGELTDEATKELEEAFDKFENS